MLLTHAHIGHYTGLMYLGREALGASAVPVYATPRMAAFLRGNGPWSLLVTQGHIDLREIAPGQPLALTPRLTVTALTVPHRDELSDTVGFRVQGPSRTLLYVPDIDKWEKWDRRLEDEVGRRGPRAARRHVLRGGRGPGPRHPRHPAPAGAGDDGAAVRARAARGACCSST